MVICRKCGHEFEAKVCHPVFGDYLCPGCYEMWVDFYLKGFERLAAKDADDEENSIEATSERVVH